jgi:hypothetical protein
MRLLLRDPFLWGSLVFVAAFPAFDFYSFETNYYEYGAFFSLSALSFVLIAVWVFWLFTCIAVASIRWSKRGWPGTLCLVAAALVFPITLVVGSSSLWQYYNFQRFYQERLDYARRANDMSGECKMGSGIAGEPPSRYLSINGTRPERLVAADGTYVLFPIFAGLSGDFTGFLYAPSLNDPITALPDLSLRFAELWDREACIFLVGTL